MVKLASLQGMETHYKSNHSTDRYWQVPLKPSPLSQIKSCSAQSQQQPRLLWRQLLGGGLRATSSNQSFVTLEQLLLWVNNSRSRTFLAFIVELSIFKLAKRAGGNITQWQWPILHLLFENSTPFFIGKNYLLTYLSFPFLASITMHFSVLLEVGVWMWQNIYAAMLYIRFQKICELYPISIFK